MTENMKKCLELMDKDDEARNKLMESEEMTKEQFREFVIAYGAKNGITLTEEDFSGDAELTDDELDAAAGGMIISWGATKVSDPWYERSSYWYQCPGCGKGMDVYLYCSKGSDLKFTSPSKCSCGRHVMH